MNFKNHLCRNLFPKSHEEREHMEADLTLVITLGVVFQVVSVPKPQFFVFWQVQRLTKVCKDQLVRISEEKELR